MTKRSELLKRKIEMTTKYKVQPLPPKAKHKKGKKYFCFYWFKAYTVLDIRPHPIWGELFTVLWDDGHQTTHATPLNKDDFMVVS